jgi:hypothetical protein
MSQAEDRKRIEEIDAILRTGAKSVTVDGVTTTWDPESLRTERAELERKVAPKTRRRPLCYKPRISG